MRNKLTIILIMLFILLFSCKNSFGQSNPDVGSESDTSIEKNGQRDSSIYNNSNFRMISDLQGSLHSIADTKSPSVVFISIEKIVKYNNPFFNFRGDPFDFFNDQREGEGRDQQGRDQQGREYKQQGFGSGVIFQKKNDSYYIITNNHVVSGADTIQITIDHERYYEGKVLGADPEIDIAVVKIETKDKLQVAELGDSGNLRVGDFVIAIGNPFGLSHSMTFGIISALGRENIGQDRSMLTKFIQTDAAINPGNSGGPLLNIEGQVIGINTMIYSQSGGNIGIGFAIPVNIAKKIARQIIETGKVEHGWLGVYFQALNTESIEMLGLKKVKNGMLVSQVMDGSPAEKSDIRTGDVLVELNGKKLVKSSDLTMVIGNAVPGSKVVFTVYRDGKMLKREVVLGNRDALSLQEEQVEEPSGRDEDVFSLDNYGISVADITAGYRRKYSLPDSLKGVMITSIEKGSIADQYQLKRGDVIVKVNARMIEKTDDLKKEVKKIKNGAYWFIYRNGTQIIVRM